MPDRIIKESVRRSKTLDGLSWFQIVCFLYLTTAVDDYGRFYRDPQILKSELFPRKGDIDIEEIDEAMDVLEERGLIKSYVWDDERYLQVVTWDKHQRTRAKKSKFPDARGKYESIVKKTKASDNKSTTDDSNLTTSDVKCQQVADIGQQMCPNAKANAKANSSFLQGESLEDDENLISIQKEQDEIFDKARSVGFPLTEQNIKNLMELYDSVGIMPVLEGIEKAGKYNHVSFAYIETVANNYGKEKQEDDGKMSEEEQQAILASLL